MSKYAMKKRSQFRLLASFAASACALLPLTASSTNVAPPVPNKTPTEAAKQIPNVTRASITMMALNTAARTPQCLPGPGNEKYVGQLGFELKNTGNAPIPAQGATVNVTLRVGAVKSHSMGITLPKAIGPGETAYVASSPTSAFLPITASSVMGYMQAAKMSLPPPSVPTTLSIDSVSPAATSVTITTAKLDVPIVKDGTLCGSFKP